MQEHWKVTNDWDGVHGYAPPPLNTGIELLFRGNLYLPESLEVIHTSEKSVSTLNYLFHKIRSVNSNNTAALAHIRLAAEAHNHDIEFIILSGRPIAMKKMTMEKVVAGHLDTYINDFHLNPGVNSALWKEYKVRNLIERNYHVVHLEDDIRAGLCVARVNVDGRRPLVYMIRNISNHPRLLRRGHIEKPENIIFVNSVMEAAQDLVERWKSN